MNDDLIRREDALGCFHDWIDKYGNVYTPDDMPEYRAIEQLPSAQPEIVRCRECKFASGNSRICMKFGYGPIGELDFCAWGERKDNDE